MISKGEPFEQQNKDALDSIHGQNQLYSWLVIIISICYSLPAIQIVMQQQQIASGRQKNCDNSWNDIIQSTTLPNVYKWNQVPSNQTKQIHWNIYEQ